ncbi:MAG: polysaccharide deacetylase family protein [Actinomycetota bacterium]|nr:polysaccharide deacetylase family protein [Actinomycetota bacterium]
MVAISRRGALGLGAVVGASVLAGCGRAATTRHASTASAPSSATVTHGPSSAPATAMPSTPPGASTPAAGPGPAVEYRRGAGTRPQVALTFHGAGDPGIARELLAIFATHHAKVTVLAVGSWLAANPAMASEILGAGHELGNHTFNHLDIDSLDTAAARSEIVRCRDVLRSLAGTGGEVFRPSQTQFATPLVRTLAGEAGYRVCLSYDIDSLDYTDPGPAAVRAHVATATAGSIVSMHFGHPGTVAAMPSVLDDLTARGLRPVTATTLLAP